MLNLTSWPTLTPAADHMSLGHGIDVASGNSCCLLTCLLSLHVYIVPESRYCPAQPCFGYIMLCWSPKLQWLCFDGMELIRSDLFRVRPFSMCIYITVWGQSHQHASKTVDSVVGNNHLTHKDGCHIHVVVLVVVGTVA